MRVVVKTSNLSRGVWLKYRTQGIGGSDASVIAGINSYKSARRLWLEKQGRSSQRKQKTSIPILASSWSLW